MRYEYSTFVENMHIMIGMTRKENGRVHLEKKSIRKNHLETQ